ncbi:MAG: hypothetical protein DME47_00270 [Verrucomicrobia bacterium]|nr:MAG: hypothetical protein DME47_00270 [Verrucomicrobiota bacterium]
MCLCSRVASRAQAQKVEVRNPGNRAILWAKPKFAPEPLTGTRFEAASLDPLRSALSGKCAHGLIRRAKAADL